MAELADAPDLGSGAARHAGSTPVTRTTASQTPLKSKSDVQKLNVRFFIIALLLRLFRKRSRLLRLLACKRAHDAFAALPPFCGHAACGGTWLSLWARRVKQTARWAVCSQSGEQAVLATWAEGGSTLSRQGGDGVVRGLRGARRNAPQDL